MIERSIASHFEPDRYRVSPEEKKALAESPMLASADTSIADYVWLPFRFEGDRPYLDWTDEWRIEDFD